MAGQNFFLSRNQARYSIASMRSASIAESYSHDLEDNWTPLHNRTSRIENQDRYSVLDYLDFIIMWILLE